MYMTEERATKKILSYAERDAFRTLVREARLRKGMTQLEVARQTGVSQSLISGWENTGPSEGTRLIDALTLLHFYNIRLAQVASLLGFEEQEVTAENQALVDTLVQEVLTLKDGNREAALRAIQALLKGFQGV